MQLCKLNITYLVVKFLTQKKREAQCAIKADHGVIYKSVWRVKTFFSGTALSLRNIQCNISLKNPTCCHFLSVLNIIYLVFALVEQPLLSWKEKEITEIIIQKTGKKEM